MHSEQVKQLFFFFFLLQNDQSAHSQIFVSRPSPSSIQSVPAIALNSYELESQGVMDRLTVLMFAFTMVSDVGTHKCPRQKEENSFCNTT